jgi:hypothetical protein
VAGGAPGALLVGGTEAEAVALLKLGGGGRAGTSRAAKIKDYRLPCLIISV